MNGESFIRGAILEEKVIYFYGDIGIFRDYWDSYDFLRGLRFNFKIFEFLEIVIQKIIESFQKILKIFIEIYKIYFEIFSN